MMQKKGTAQTRENHGVFLRRSRRTTQETNVTPSYFDRCDILPFRVESGREEAQSGAGLEESSGLLNQTLDANREKS